jgi:hypothetical protein
MLGMTVLLVVLTITTLTVYASHEKTKVNFANITTAVAAKYVTTNSLHDEIRCSTYSFTRSPGTNITHIGYNSFSCRSERSDGDVAQWTAPSGSLDYNDWHQYESHTLDHDSVSGGNRKGIGAGVHDFGHYNGTSYNWDPAHSVVTYFYP